VFVSIIYIYLSADAAVFGELFYFAFESFFGFSTRVLGSLRPIDGMIDNICDRVFRVIR